MKTKKKGVGALVRARLKSGVRAYETMERAVRESFPESKFNRKAFSWYLCTNKAKSKDRKLGGDKDL